MRMAESPFLLLGSVRAGELASCFPFCDYLQSRGPDGSLKPTTTMNIFMLRAQAYLGDVAGSVLDHLNKESHGPFAGGGFCLLSVKTNNPLHLKYNTVKCNKVSILSSTLKGL